MPNIPREIRLCQPIDYLYGEEEKKKREKYSPMSMDILTLVQTILGLCRKFLVRKYEESIHSIKSMHVQCFLYSVSID